MSKIQDVFTFETGIGILVRRLKEDKRLYLIDLDITEATKLKLDLENAIKEYYKNGQRYAGLIKE